MSARRPAGAARFGVARVLSKAGFCSRSQAERHVREGRVTVNGRRVLDPETPVRMEVDAVAVDGRPLSRVEPVHLMLNKPRGLVTTTRDEQTRATVYECFVGADLPWIAPVGRLDKASEGLLLFTNDPQWAARITDPEGQVLKHYRVQVRGSVDAALERRLGEGIDCEGEILSAHSVSVLRQSERTAWLDIVLDEGRNRQIRRMLEASGLEVLRLMRVSIGGLSLGDLGKGQWRLLEPRDLDALSQAPGPIIAPEN